MRCKNGMSCRVLGAIRRKGSKCDQFEYLAKLQPNRFNCGLQVVSLLLA